MRRAEENYLTMANVTVSLLVNNQNKWTGNTAVGECVDHISGALDAISGARQGGGSAVSKGVTMDKDEAEAEAIDLVMELAGYAQAYARRQHNNELLEQMKAIKRRDLDKMEDDALTGALTDAYTRLDAIKTAAQAYGVTAARLTALAAATATYDGLKDKPRAVIVTRKGANSTVPAQMKILRNEFKILDLLMASFATTQPSFLTDYRNSRIVIDRGGGHNEAPPVTPGS